MDKTLTELVQCITKSDDYLACLRYKKQLAQNEVIMNHISHIKQLQKECVRHTEDLVVKETLNQEIKSLQAIPIYSVYMYHLEQVNTMISYVKDELNDYFYQVFNQFSI